MHSHLFSPTSWGPESSPGQARPAGEPSEGPPLGSSGEQNLVLSPDPHKEL